MRFYVLFTLLGLFSCHAASGAKGPEIEVDESQPYVFEPVVGGGRYYTGNNCQQVYARMSPEAHRIFDSIRMPLVRRHPTLQGFLTTKSYKRFAAEAAPLSVQEKEDLMRSIKCFCMGEDWPAMRNYMAALVNAGASIDTNIDVSDTHPDTFLSKAVMWRDVEGVKFALAHGADVAARQNSQGAHILERVHTAEIARLIVSHVSVASLDSHQQFNILKGALSDDAEPQVLAVFQEAGFDLQVQDGQEGTLLHALCKGTRMDITSPEEFEAKFSTLIKAGVNRNARDTSGVTARDIAKDRGINWQVAVKAEALFQQLETEDQAS